MSIMRETSKSIFLKKNLYCKTKIQDGKKNITKIYNILSQTWYKSNGTTQKILRCL